MASGSDNSPARERQSVTADASAVGGRTPLVGDALIRLAGVTKHCEGADDPAVDEVSLTSCCTPSPCARSAEPNTPASPAHQQRLRTPTAHPARPRRDRGRGSPATRQLGSSIENRRGYPSRMKG